MNKPRPCKFTRDDVEITDDAVLHQGYFTCRRLQLRYPFYAGGVSDLVTRDIVSKCPAIMVIPFDPVRNSVVLIQQFRVGSLYHRECPWLLEVVAGVQDENQSPEQTAVAELLQETGLVARSLHRVFDFDSSPGYSTEYITVFLALVDSSQANEFAGLESESEDIVVSVVTLDELSDLLRENRVVNGPALISLQWLLLNRDRLSTFSN